VSNAYHLHHGYPVVEPRGYEKDLLERAVEEARIKLLPALDLGPLTVFCTVPGGLSGKSEQVLGAYIVGTNKSPVIGMDLTGLRQSAKQDGVSWEFNVRATLARELGRAYGESLGARGDDENAVEAFADAFVVENLIDVDTLRHALESLEVRRHTRRR
jgi:hypothetical protein